jgi:hypothetical protein
VELQEVFACGGGISSSKFTNNYYFAVGFSYVSISVVVEQGLSTCRGRMAQFVFYPGRLDDEIIFLAFIFFIIIIFGERPDCATVACSCPCCISGRNYSKNSLLRLHSQLQ